ncbi:MAG: LysR family transcriptional regulator [Bacteriovoracaceae bacterium]
MNLYHLQYFLDAARTLSLTQAAQINHVSQSAISQAIRSLESFYEVMLVEHKKRQFKLTPSGLKLFELGESLIAQSKLIKESIKEKEDLSGEIIIGCTQSFMMGPMKNILKKLKKELPLVKPIFKIGYSDMIKTWLQKNEIALGFIVDDGDSKNFNSEILQKGNFVSISPLKSEPDLEYIVTRLDKIEVKELQIAYKKKFKKTLTIHRQVLSWEVIRSLVEGGYGEGLVPDYAVDNKVQIISKMPKIPYELKVIWKKERTLTKKEKILLTLFH